MKRAITIGAILVVVLAVVAGGWWYVNRNPGTLESAQGELDAAIAELGLVPEEEPAGIVASGFIEADEASVTTELGGRIVALDADEGDEVVRGQELVLLDDALLRSQVEVAEAELGVAAANLALVKADVKQETLDHALALLAQGKSAQDATRVAWKDAQTIADNPQELDVAIAAAQAELGVLNHQERQARALADAAQVGRNLADETVQLLEELHGSTMRFRFGSQVYRMKIRFPGNVIPDARSEQATATYQSWQAWTGLDQAEVAKAGTMSYLSELKRQRANPVDLLAHANRAKSEYEVAAAAVEVAQAQVEGLQIGATPEQIAAADAQVEIASAALDALEVQLDQLTLEAPISGLVLARPVHVGEVALPGAPLMTLADLENVTLTVYVPTDQLGQVQLGQEVSVQVDAYPGRTFTGTVSFIASEAEFTPKNVQTREERVNMVFAVKVKLPNPDHALKPGMPADAVLHESSQNG